MPATDCSTMAHVLCAILGNAIQVASVNWCPRAIQRRNRYNTCHMWEGPENCSCYYAAASSRRSAGASAALRSYRTAMS